MLLRKLGSCEKLAFLLEQQCHCNFTLVADTSLIDPTIFNKAAEITLSQHPLLNAEILFSNNELWFSSAQKSPLEISHLYNIQDISKEIESCLTNKFDPKHPPFVKIKCLHTELETKILITFYHVVSDAASGTCFLSDILSFCDTLVRNNQISPTQYPLRESIETLTDSNINILEYDSIILEKEHYKKKKTPAMDIGIISIHLPRQDINFLSRESELKHMTAHHILSSAAVFALKNQVETKLISLVSPVNARRILRLDIKPQEFGYYLSRTDINVSINNSLTIESLAQKIKYESNLQLYKDYVLTTIRILGELAENLTETDFILTSETPIVLLSNTGKADKFFKKYDHITLSNVQYFMAPQAISLNRNSYCIVVTIYHDTLNINLSYNKKNVSSNKATIFAEDLIRLLTHS